MKRFVLSSKSFDSIQEAEKKVLGWYRSGSLKQGTRLYEVKEVYKLKLKFIKKKK